MYRESNPVWLRLVCAVTISSIGSHVVSYVGWKLKQLFLKNGPTPASFLFYSRSFQIQILQKKCRLQRDSNSDCRSRRRARWPLDHQHVPTKTKCLSIQLQKNLKNLQFANQFYNLQRKKGETWEDQSLSFSLFKAFSFSLSFFLLKSFTPFSIYIFLPL